MSGGWPGLVPSIRRFFLGAASAPRAKRRGETSTPTSSTYYEGMPEDYRWFRQDELVRRCVVTNAFFATMTSGFRTVLEASGEGVDPGDYAPGGDGGGRGPGGLRLREGGHR